MKFILSLIVLQVSITSFSQRISGSVKDDRGNPLPNASIVIKGTTIGTTANNDGNYFLDLKSPGTYTLIAQHVGLKRDVKTITVGKEDLTVDFQLAVIDLAMEEVIIVSGENRANNIIRNTIQKRPYYQSQLDKFKCEVYTKGILKLRDYPKKLLGQKLDFGDGDTSKQKIVYLSETIARYSVDKPRNSKIEVISSRVSGSSDGYGLAAPQFYSFYDNNVNIGTNLNPRGFISPISENAMHFYKYKYEGAYFEEGKQINRIIVTPKRRYEPLFSGYINIVQDEWRIHSLKLILTKESQMEILDSLTIEQTYVPVTDSIWVIHNQVIYPAVKIFGIDAYGSFVNIYSHVDPSPVFGKKYFDNTILKYLDSSTRKTPAYWEEVRPVKLLEDEIRDYRKKDSLEQASRNPVYLDSVDRENNKINLIGVFLLGENFNREKRKESFYIKSLTEQISFNIVEGLVVNFGGTYTKRLDSVVGRRSLRISPNIRYGFSNKHFNAYLGVSYIFGKKYISSINISGGKRVFQFNNASPISPRSNTIASLLGENNLLKLYEAYYLRSTFTKGIGEGLTWSIGFEYQDRMPLENTTDYTWRDRKTKEYTPNYPTELMFENIKRHQAFSTSVALTWQPGARYVELPDRKINIGSSWPAISLSYTRAVDIFGSELDYSKWKFGLTDIISFRLAGMFNYRLGMGGFLDNKKLLVPDYQHFNGNISTIATPYLNSFQILPIYEFSNISKFYALAHLEYHFNGLLTNKIPGFRKLNWYLVGGTNMFHYNQTDYTEVSIGLENILKSIRVDYYWSFKDGKRYKSDFRIGLVTRLGRDED